MLRRPLLLHVRKPSICWWSFTHSNGKQPSRAWVDCYWDLDLWRHHSNHLHRVLQKHPSCNSSHQSNSNLYGGKSQNYYNSLRHVPGYGILLANSGNLLHIVGVGIHLYLQFWKGNEVQRRFTVRLRQLERNNQVLSGLLHLRPFLVLYPVIAGTASSLSACASLSSLLQHLTGTSVTATKSSKMKATSAKAFGEDYSITEDPLPLEHLSYS